MFSGTHTITEGSYEYKYLNGCGGWESVANASLNLDGCVTDTVIRDALTVLRKTAVLF